MTEESEAAQWLNHFPPAELTAVEFEGFVAELINSVGHEIDDLRVAVHDRVWAVDGTYDFDATVRFRWGGLGFLVFVEAKRHADLIKREHVQALQKKALREGAHKAVMFSTSPFGRGALTFAIGHDIPLVFVTEGRFAITTSAAEHAPVLTREQAKKRFGVPTFIGFAYGCGDGPRSIRRVLLAREHPEYIMEVILGIP